MLKLPLGMTGNPMGIKNNPALTRRMYEVLATFALALSLAGCNTLAKKSNTGVVVARRAQVRSSTAVVAADLVEVAPGDQVEILDTETVAETGAKWVRGRAHI